MHRWVKRLTFPLRTALVTAVVASATLVLILAVGSIGVPAYSKVKNVIRELWKDLARQAAEAATDEVLKYFQGAPIALRFIDGLVQERELGLNALETILDICYRALKENTDFVTVYYARIDGTFYGVFKIAGQYMGSYRTLEQDGKTRIRNYKIGPNNCWVQESEETSDYDPRKRPFWKTGQEHPEGGWSQPYQFVTTKAQGYSYVLADRGENGIAGYWAIDFQIDKLADYLQGLNIGREGMVYIVGEDGSIIAKSTPQNVSSHKSRVDEFIEKKWGQHPQEERKSGFFDEKSEIFYINHFPKESGIPWSIVTVIRENDYLLPIRRSAYHSLLIGLVPCVFFLFLSAVFFGRISRRLKEISGEMDQAGNLMIDPSGRDLRPSRIREINIMNHSLRKMKVGLQSFAKYVPVDLINKLIASGRSAELGGEKADITVMFADMAQFTTLSEHIGPDEVAHIIEKFLTMSSKQVHKEKGIIDKFMGDAVMALWGVPEPIANAPLAACRAALQMQRIASEHVLMNHRIGINSGNAMIGNLGSEERMDYTAVGDTVNIAARLEKLNKKYETKILIGPYTAQAVKDQLLVRPVDWVMLQGRTNTLLVYELLMDKASAPQKLTQAVSTYAEALELYWNREFHKASQLFDEARQLFGGSDIPSFMLADRCRAFEKKAPPEDWDGTSGVSGT